MQNSEQFKAIEVAWAMQSDETVISAGEIALREMGGPAAANVSGGFLRSARRLYLQGRRADRRRWRIESIMPAVQQVWPDAEFADCGDYFRIYPDGVPGEPEISGELVKEAL